MKDTWNLSTVYSNIEAFDKDLEDIKTRLLEEMKKCEGKLNDEKVFLKYMRGDA